MNTDQAIENLIQTKQANVAPRVTVADVNSAFEQVKFITVHQPGGTTSTFVHAYLNGDFYLASGHSACVSVANYNPEIGERIARGKAESAARDKLWELMGYELRSKLFEQAKANQATWADVATHTISEDAISQSVSYKVTLKDGKGTWRGTLPIQLDWDSLSYIQAAVIEDINRQLAAQVR